MLNSRLVKSEKFSSTERILVVLHGYGSCGADFAEVGELFLSKKLDNTVFLFPDAPYKCENQNFPCASFEWFKLSQEITEEEIRKGLNNTAPILYEFISTATRTYGCKNVCLIGFSQGAMLAFEMLYYPGTSKIIAYSGLFSEQTDKTIHSNADVMIVHATDDHVVPYQNATSAFDRLRLMGLNVSLKTCHNIGHSISLDGWNYGVDFLLNFR